MKAEVNREVTVKLELSAHEFEMIRIAVDNVGPSAAANVGFHYEDFVELEEALREVIV